MKILNKIGLGEFEMRKNGETFILKDIYMDSEMAFKDYELDQVAELIKRAKELLMD